MQLNPSEISDLIKSKIDKFEVSNHQFSVGIHYFF